MMYNPNLMYAIYPIVANTQDIMETFFVNTVWKNHKVNQGNKDACYIIDENKTYRIINSQQTTKQRYMPDNIYAEYNTTVGHDNHIPLWMFGLLY